MLILASTGVPATGMKPRDCAASARKASREHFVKSIKVAQDCANVALFASYSYSSLLNRFYFAHYSQRPHRPYSEHCLQRRCLTG